jgi:hypothetical protein
VSPADEEISKLCNYERPLAMALFLRLSRGTEAQNHRDGDAERDG